MLSEYHKEWGVNMKKIISNHAKQFQKYIRIDSECPSEVLYKQQMQLFKSVRKLYLFINRTKLQYFSFQPRMLKFWRTVTYKRNYFMNQIDTMLINKTYNDTQHKYLILFRKTLEKYDPTYGLQIGLILHRRLNRDVALVINEYLF